MLVQSPSPKKPAAKKPAAPKKAPGASLKVSFKLNESLLTAGSAAKKGVAKATGPKKASEGGPKAKAVPRKTKKQKEEEAAAAEAADQEDNEDEDMQEGNEDSKSLNFIAPISQVPKSKPVEPVVEAVALPAPADSVQSAEAAGSVEVVSISIPMNDEYEAYIREMSMTRWLEWKVEVGYTFDIINV